MHEQGDERTRRTVLVADDRPIGRQMLVALLSANGCRVIEAADGVEALDAVRRERPDLIVLDYRMPRLNGREVLVRLHEEQNQVPVIVYTANSDEASRLIEVSDRIRILSKPAEPFELIQTAAALLGQEPGPLVSAGPHDQVVLATIIDAQADLAEIVGADAVADATVRRCRDLFSAHHVAIVVDGSTVAECGGPLAGAAPLTIPFTASRRPLGTLTVERHTPFTLIEERALSALALFAALMYENQELLREERARGTALDSARRQAEKLLDRRTGVLRETTSALASRTVAQQVLAAISLGAMGSADAAITLDYAVRRVAEALDATVAALLQLDGGGRLVTRATFRQGDAGEIDIALAWTALHAGHPTTDGGNCAVPVHFEGRDAGVIVVGRTLTTYASAEVDFLRSVAAVVAMTWSRKRHQQLMLAEAEAARRLAHATSLRAVSSPLLSAVCDLVGWQLAQLWVEDQSGAIELVGAGHSSSVDRDLASRFAAASRQSKLQRGAFLSGRVMEAGRSSSSTTLASDIEPDRAAVAAEMAMSAALVVPVWGNDRVIGLLELFTRDGHAPDPDVAVTIEGVGREIAHFIERDAARRALAAHEEKYRTLVEHLPNGIFELAPDATIDYLNPRMRELIGAPPAARFFDYIAEGDRERFAAALAACWNGAPLDLSCRLLAANGETLRVEVHAALVSRPEARKAVVGSVHDVTELLRLQDERRQMHTAAALGKLVAGVAHEVRNPLFNISSSVELLGMLRKEDLEVRRTTDILLAEVGRLTRLMRELLDYARPQLVRHSMRPLDQIVGAAVASVRQVAASKHITVTMPDHARFPEIMCDAESLRRAVVNVLENAISFAPEASTVDIALERDARGLLALCIRDCGPGFVEEEIDRVFDPFYSRREDGTGLGLALVQRIVDDHGGRVSARNRFNGGAEVTIALPLASTESA